MGFQAVVELVRSMSPKDQARLVMLIEDALLTEANEIELSRAQIKEIRRRVAAHQADPASAIPWKDVSARVKKQLKELGE